jgi:glutamate decarboxylase
MPLSFSYPDQPPLTTSTGHKYGLVAPGLGWIIWRDQSYLPKELIFELHYLGGTEESYTLNFSRPGAQVVVQYYNLIHLGFAGYREVMENCLANARILSKSLEATGWYTCLSDIHRPRDNNIKFNNPRQPSSSSAAVPHEDDDNDYEAETETSASYTPGLPVVAFRLSDEFQAQYPHVKQETISLLLRARQWIIPNYALPPGEASTEILRVVVRESMSFDLLDRLVTDIVQVTETLMENEEQDLGILTRQRKGPVVATDGKKGRGEGKGGEATKEKGEQRPGKADGVGEKVKGLGKEAKKRMEDGIHRSVC